MPTYSIRIHRVPLAGFINALAIKLYSQTSDVWETTPSLTESSYLFTFSIGKVLVMISIASKFDDGLDSTAILASSTTCYEYTGLIPPESSIHLDVRIFLKMKQLDLTDVRRPVDLFSVKNRQTTTD